MFLVDPAGGIGFLIVIILILALWLASKKGAEQDREERIMRKYAKYGKQQYLEKMKQREATKDAVMNTAFDVLSSLMSNYKDKDDPRNW